MPNGVPLSWKSVVKFHLSESALPPPPPDLFGKLLSILNILCEVRSIRKLQNGCFLYSLFNCLDCELFPSCKNLIKNVLKKWQ